MGKGSLNPFTLLHFSPFPPLRRRGGSLRGYLFGDVLLVEDDGELRAEHEYEARHVAPGEHGDDRADRAVDFVVVEVLKARSEEVLARLPEQPREHGARQRVAERDAPVRHEPVDDGEERDGDERARDGEERLPERVPDEREPRRAADDPQRQLVNQLLKADEYGREEDRED